MSVSFAFTIKPKPPSFLPKGVKCSSGNCGPRRWSWRDKSQDIKDDYKRELTSSPQGKHKTGQTATICLELAFGIKRYPHWR